MILKCSPVFPGHTVTKGMSILWEAVGGVKEGILFSQSNVRGLDSCERALVILPEDPC